jgi:hypothetical protein
MTKTKPEANCGHCTTKKGIKKAAKITPTPSPLTSGFCAARPEKQIPDMDMGTNP